MPDLSPEQWSHYTARVNGINIHYVMEGEGDPLVFLHGWPEFWYSWRHQIPEFSQRYRVIVPDLRGFGHSDKPFYGYDTRSSASDVYELVRQLGHDRVRIVSHDIGARVAFRFALDHEGSVQKIAFLDATPPYEQLGPQEPSVVRERWHSYFHQQFDLPEKLLEGREEVYLRHIMRDWTINKYPLTQEVIDEYVRVYSAPGGLRGGFNYYRAAALPRPCRLAGRRGPATVYPRLVPLRYPPRAHRRSHGRRAVGRRLAGRDPRGAVQALGRLRPLPPMGVPRGGQRSVD